MVSPLSLCLLLWCSSCVCMAMPTGGARLPACTIAVAGANGRVGAMVVRELLRTEPAVSVCALVRTCGGGLVASHRKSLGPAAGSATVLGNAGGPPAAACEPRLTAPLGPGKAAAGPCGDGADVCGAMTLAVGTRGPWRRPPKSPGRVSE